MIITHIDKEVVIDALVAVKNNPSKVYRNFENFLHDHTDLMLYGPLELNEVNIISSLLHSRGETSLHRTDNQLKDVEINEHNPYQILFYSNSVSKSSVLLTADIKDYISKFQILSDEKYWRVNDPESSNNLTNWDELFLDIPVEEVVIVDSYLFKNSECLDENYFNILISLRKSSIKCLTIFTNWFDYFIKQSIIKDGTKKILGQNIVFNVYGIPDQEHDRYIFLNYYYISSGSSFNPFNNEGKPSSKKSSTISRKSLTNKQNFEIQVEVLRSLKIKGMKLCIEKSLHWKELKLYEAKNSIL